MGQKVHPVAFRLGGIQNWRSRWFTKKKYQDFLKEDYFIRNFLVRKLIKAGVERIEIERSSNYLNIVIFAARPGLIIGRGGSGIEDLRLELKRALYKNFKILLKKDLRLSVEEVKGAESKAAVAAQGMAEQIEKRLPFRRVLKQGIDRISQAKDVQGVKIMIKGRLDGMKLPEKNGCAKAEFLCRPYAPILTMRKQRPTQLTALSA
jgi:small subunit ribosomal protein S3